MHTQGEMRLERNERDLPPLDLDLSGFNAITDYIRQHLPKPEKRTEASPE